MSETATRVLRAHAAIRAGDLPPAKTAAERETRRRAYPDGYWSNDERARWVSFLARSAPQLARELLRAEASWWRDRERILRLERVTDATIVTCGALAILVIYLLAWR